jgi:very-short-patch-repair endonuclease
VKNPTRVARLLRKQDTWAERMLWSWLRSRRFSSYKFRRQHYFGDHVLDVFCIEARLNIERDGSFHGRPKEQKADAARDAWLQARGVKVLRFWNFRLIKDRQLVRDTI